ncbi:MAG: hypothetical protein ABSG11_22970 [Candidatus Korobacteraceae bacterium]
MPRRGIFCTIPSFGSTYYGGDQSCSGDGIGAGCGVVWKITP